MTGAVSVGPIPHDFDRWDELLAVIRASFAYMDGVIDPPSSVHRLTARSLRAKATVELGFLATAGDEIAGSAFLSEKDDHCYLGKLAVAPAWQGRGIGRLLLQAVEEHARRAGKPVIELGTRVELIANQRLFARLGFVEIERVAHEGFDRPTSVTMRKALA